MTLLQALFMAALQGVTELFPVSSLAHGIITPKILGWDIDLKSEAFLPFLVAMHVGTASAAFLYFWNDWWKMGRAVLGQGTPDTVKRERHMLVQIIIATIPAVLIALILQKKLYLIFGMPELAAGFLILNGFLLFLGERRRRRGGERILADLTWVDSLLIGLAQSLALLPGISRSGTTMISGLLRGFHHEDAARFSFLISFPIIMGAGVHELPKLLHAEAGIVHLSIIAGITAAVISYATIFALMRYFKGNDIKALDPFAIYCWVAGAASLALLLS